MYHFYFILLSTSIIIYLLFLFYLKDYLCHPHFARSKDQGNVYVYSRLGLPLFGVVAQIYVIHVWKQRE